MARKLLSRAEGVQAACILFELNTDDAQLQRLAEYADQAGLKVDKDAWCQQWYGFVHAAVVAALMVHAPNVVLADYLRSTTDVLERRGLPREACPAFIDTVFAPYMKMLAEEKPQDCPEHFLRSLGQHPEVKFDSHKALALISGTMALLLSSMADKLELYEISSE